VADQHPEVNCDLVRQAIIDSAATKYRIVTHPWADSPTSTTDDGCDIPTEAQVDERV
jgi:hypothetical protein